MAVALLVTAPASRANDLQAQPTTGAVTTHQEMVVTAHPLATEAGAKVLKNGGTAADAMVAVQTVLGLVEPQATGLGGGAFIVYYDAASGQLTTIDAREKAPATATENRFASLSFNDAWQSALSVGVPGVPRMMEYAHERFGRLPWHRLFQPAIKLSLKGYERSERTERQVSQLLALNTSCEDRLFFRDEKAFKYFANPDCTAKPAGEIVRNPAYARTLLAIALGGADAFYKGPNGKAIVAAVQADRNPTGDGVLSLQDLADYKVVERAPICLWYRLQHRICGMGPPSSGALAVGQMLGILENFDLGALGPLDVETVHLFAQAGRLAFADRNVYVGDPDFVTVPAEGMLDKTYLATRAALITDVDMGTAEPGTPPGKFDPYAPQPPSIEHGTSHVSIVDRWGNALSMTTTVESFFGSGLMVNGFLLNNELTDFSFAPTDLEGTPIANRVQPGKRPRSSMSPTIVFDADGKLSHVTGSPGGSRIIGFTAQSVMNMLDFGLDPQEAIDVPHFLNRNGSTTEVEEPIPGVTLDFDREALVQALEARQYVVVPLSGEGSGLSVIQVTDDALLGGADKRRDGTVGGR